MSKSLPLFLLLPLLLLTTGCAELTFLREKVQVQDAELARLRTDNAEFQKNYYQISQDRASDQATHQQEVERLRKELDGLRAEVARLDESLQKKTLEADSAQQQLNAQLAQASQSLERLGDTAARTQVEKEKIESNYNVLSTQIETQRKQLDELQKKYAAEEAARKASETELADTKAELSASTAKVAELSGVQEQAKQMSAQIDELKKQPKGIALESDAELKTAAKDITAKLAAAGLKGANVMHDSRGVRIILPSDATFNPRSVTLTPQAESALRVLGETLNAYSSRVIRVEGHTDDQPVYDLPFADNWGLGSARADRVREYLVEFANLRAPHLEMISRGSSDPLADNKTPEGRAVNRRVEIVVGAPKK